MVGCPFLNRNKIAWLLMGENFFFMPLDIWTRMKQETVAIFQNLLSKLPYFKHKHQELNILVHHDGQEIKSELQSHR